MIPILVNGAKMPSSADLPLEIDELSLKHALELSSSRWNYDVGELIKILEKIIPRKKTEPVFNQRHSQPIRPPQPPKPKTWWSKNYLWLLGSAVGILVLVGLCDSD